MDKNWSAVAHEAARAGRLPEGLKLRGLLDRKGRTVAEAAARARLLPRGVYF
jgi:hypothetical protein